MIVFPIASKEAIWLASGSFMWISFNNRNNPSFCHIKISEWWLVDDRWQVSREERSFIAPIAVFRSNSVDACIETHIWFLPLQYTYGMWSKRHVVLSDLSLRTFSSKDVGLMENEVLSCLDYDILFVTSFDFILFDLVSIQADSKLTFLSLVLVNGILED